jgi:hypothetical protein
MQNNESTATEARTYSTDRVITTYGALLCKVNKSRKVGDKIWYDCYLYTVVKISGNAAIVE